MQIAVKIRQEFVDMLLTGPSGKGPVRTLATALQDLGLSLSPMHPESADPELRAWFIIETPQGADPGETARSLLTHDSVLAAYPKPPDEPP
jgi:hypothetical protein